jgi:hypothetical protein
MVRTQISLTEQQHAFLKETATQSGVSLSELIRRAVDGMMCQPEPSVTAAARSLIGAFQSDVADVSKRHDEHLANIYGRLNE